MKNICEHLTYWNARNPNNIGIQTLNGSLTFRVIFQLTKRIVIALRKNNIKYGDTACILNTDPIESWLLFLGLSHEGVTASFSVPSRLPTTDYEFDWYLSPSAIEIDSQKPLITDKAWFENLKEISPQEIKNVLPKKLEANHINHIVLTSGPTGKPKPRPRCLLGAWSTRMRRPARLTFWSRMMRGL